MRGTVTQKTGAQACQERRFRLNSLCIAAGNAGCGQQAGALGATVHQNGALPTIACVTSHFGAFEAEMFAQSLGQALGWGYVQRGGGAVQGEADHGQAPAYLFACKLLCDGTKRLSAFLSDAKGLDTAKACP